jgi:isopenicillin N synthase-like dioxygenase
VGANYEALIKEAGLYKARRGREAADHRVRMITVPVIDLASARHGSRAQRLACARAIDEACRDIGFFAIHGHGVGEELVGDRRRRAHEFFALPLGEQAGLPPSHPGNQPRLYTRALS